MLPPSPTRTVTLAAALAASLLLSAGQPTSAQPYDNQTIVEDYGDTAYGDAGMTYDEGGVIPGDAGISHGEPGAMYENADAPYAGSGGECSAAGAPCGGSDWSDGSQPNHCGMLAPSYPVPHPVPLWVGQTQLTYPPMMPHHSLPHYRKVYSYRHGPGMARTTVMWHKPVLSDVWHRVRHVFELPR